MMGNYRKGDPGENGIDYGVYRRVEVRSGMEKRCGMWYVAVDIIEGRFVTSRPDGMGMCPSAKKLRTESRPRRGPRRRKAIPFLLAWKSVGGE